jgi:hypothetical protein
MREWWPGIELDSSRFLTATEFVWALEFFWFLHDVFERYKTGGMFDLRP